MKVRYLVCISGQDFVRNANETNDKGEFVYYEVDEDEAKRLIDAGYAEAEKKKGK